MQPAAFSNTSERHKRRPNFLKFSNKSNSCILLPQHQRILPSSSMAAAVLAAKRINNYCLESPVFEPIPAGDSPATSPVAPDDPACLMASDAAVASKLKRGKLCCSLRLKSKKLCDKLKPGSGSSNDSLIAIAAADAAFELQSQSGAASRPGSFSDVSFLQNFAAKAQQSRDRSPVKFPIPNLDDGGGRKSVTGSPMSQRKESGIAPSTTNNQLDSPANLPASSTAVSIADEKDNSNSREDSQPRLRRLSKAFFNAQTGAEDNKLNLMNDWEIGGTKNPWVCPSDRHLQLRAQLKSGWCVRTSVARSMTTTSTKQQLVNGLSDAEQDHIKKVLARAEAGRQSEEVRICKMMERLEKLRMRATGNGVTQCLLCQTEFGLLAAKSYAAMCMDCRKYVCQRNCGVETIDHKRNITVFLCKICSEYREVMWKKSGAWFYREVPVRRPSSALSNDLLLTPNMHNAAATMPFSAGNSPLLSRQMLDANNLMMGEHELAMRLNNSLKQRDDLVGRTLSGGEKGGGGAGGIKLLPRGNPYGMEIQRLRVSPRARITPSWVTEKVQSSLSFDESDEESSSSSSLNANEFQRPTELNSSSNNIAAASSFGGGKNIQQTQPHQANLHQQQEPGGGASSNLQARLPHRRPRHHHQNAAKRSAGSGGGGQQPLRAPNKCQGRVTDTDESANDECSRHSTPSTSPQHSIATPSSYGGDDMMQHSISVGAVEPVSDSKSIDSGVVQSDHSAQMQLQQLQLQQQQQALWSGVTTSLAFQPPNTSASMTGISAAAAAMFPPSHHKTSISSSTPPPIPPRNQGSSPEGKGSVASSSGHHPSSSAAAANFHSQHWNGRPASVASSNFSHSSAPVGGWYSNNPNSSSTTTPQHNHHNAHQRGPRGAMIQQSSRESLIQRQNAMMSSSLTQHQQQTSPKQVSKSSHHHHNNDEGSPVLLLQMPVSVSAVAGPLMDLSRRSTQSTMPTMDIPIREEDDMTAVSPCFISSADEETKRQQHHHQRTRCLPRGRTAETSTPDTPLSPLTTPNVHKFCDDEKLALPGAASGAGASKIAPMLSVESGAGTDDGGPQPPQQQKRRRPHPLPIVNNDSSSSLCRLPPFSESPCGSGGGGDGGGGIGQHFSQNSLVVASHALDAAAGDDDAEEGEGAREQLSRCGQRSATSSLIDELGTLGSIEFQLTYLQNDKQLIIHLMRAKNLKAMDKNGFSDPYCKFHLLPGNTKATKLTSKTIEKTLNPEWNEEMIYYGITEEEKLRKTLRITVLDRDRIGADFLGETRVPLKRLPIGETKRFNLFLEYALAVAVDDKYPLERGKILMSVCYNIQQASLFVAIKRCAELLGMDATGFSDPYCKISLTPLASKAHRQRTSTKKRTLNPEFNETLQFIVPFKDLPKKALEIGVYDYDVARHDDYIGGIVLSTAAPAERGKHWHQVIENPGKTFEYWHKLEADD